MLEKRTVSNQDSVSQRFTYDASGLLVGITDTRALLVKRVSRDLLGRIVRTDHSDTGVTQQLLAATGEVLRLWDPLGRVTRYRYDANARMTHAYFAPLNGVEMLVERVIWGGGEVSIPDAEINNLVGVPHIKLSSGGLVRIEACDWNGQATNTSRQTARHSTRPLTGCLSMLFLTRPRLSRHLPTARRHCLNVKVWRTRTEYDALGRVARRMGEAIGTISYQYGANARVEGAHLALHKGPEVQLIQEVRYDSAGRPSIIRFGNGSWVRRHFNPSGRLAHIVAAVRGQDEPTQDLSIAYDPNGNVTILGEGSNLLAAYTYDGIDRLVRAEGRVDKTPYADTYGLDTEGNILEYRHKSGPLDRTTAYDYQAGSNQLRSETVQDPVLNLPGPPIITTPQAVSLMRPAVVRTVGIRVDDCRGLNSMLAQWCIWVTRLEGQLMRRVVVDQ